MPAMPRPRHRPRRPRLHLWRDRRGRASTGRFCCRVMGRQRIGWRLESCLAFGPARWSWHNAAPQNKTRLGMGRRHGRRRGMGRPGCIPGHGVAAWGDCPQGCRQGGAGMPLHPRSPRPRPRVHSRFFASRAAPCLGPPHHPRRRPDGRWLHPGRLRSPLRDRPNGPGSGWWLPAMGGAWVDAMGHGPNRRPRRGRRPPRLGAHALVGRRHPSPRRRPRPAPGLRLGIHGSTAPRLGPRRRLAFGVPTPGRARHAPPCGHCWLASHPAETPSRPLRSPPASATSMPCLQPRPRFLPPRPPAAPPNVHFSPGPCSWSKTNLLALS